MRALIILSPYILYVIGAILWHSTLYYFIGAQRGFLNMTLFLTYSILFLILLAYTPDKWFQATPTEQQDADVVVILSFGYELKGSKEIPGKANQFLAEWVISNMSPKTETVLAQEGVFIALGERMSRNINLNRIHQHERGNYVNTIDAAFCAIEQIKKLHKNTIAIVAHDLQIQRAIWDFERVIKKSCPKCNIIIPKIPDTPYPDSSIHLQTRNEAIYKLVELLIARPRDLFSSVPTQCKAPLSSE
jgi:uncharacterized SAM-binding protein YcdF (DUF218 family)